MKLNKKYLHFMRWFRDQEVSIHQGQWSDESIARNAFYEGVKYQKYLDSENESSVSDDQEKHGDLHDVRIRNASDQVAEDPQTSGELPLRSRTDTEKVCPHCNGTGHYSYGGSFGGPRHTFKCNCGQTW